MVHRLWSPVTEAGAAFLESVRSVPDETLLALDFDGTLAPIVDDPERSAMHEGSAAALARLGHLVSQVAIVTGRPVDTVRRLGRLDELAGLDNLVVLGQYGVERYDAASGRVESHPVLAGIGPARRDLTELLARLAAEGRDVAGVHLEDKGIAVAVHTRRAADPDGALALLRPEVDGIAARHGLTVEPGRAVIEVRASSRTKGDALLDLVKELRASVVAMVGDDLGDLPAFEALATLRSRGLTTCAVVSSSDEQPDLAALADVICDGPDGVAQWLTELADGLEAGAAI